MIKSYLRQLFPKVLVFYYLDKDDLSFNDSIFGGIAINEFHLFDKSRKEINYNLKDNSNLKEYEADDIAIKIVTHRYQEPVYFCNIGTPQDFMSGAYQCFSQRRGIVFSEESV